jgi:hypothetical protein
MAAPNLDTAALRAADSLLILPSDPAAAEEIQRRRSDRIAAPEPVLVRLS